MLDSDQMGSLLVGVEIITRLVNRCRIYEVYLQRTHAGPAATNLRSSLVKLYTIILSFLALSDRLFDKSTGMRAIHAVFQPNATADLMKQCSELGKEVDIDARNCWQEDNKIISDKLGLSGGQVQRLLEELHQPIVRTDSRVAYLWDVGDRTERSRILIWISPIPFEENHDMARKGRTAGTGDWLLVRPQYLEWRSSSSSTILWLHGIRKFF